MNDELGLTLPDPDGEWEAPDLTHAITGYRRWRMDVDGWLMSGAVGYAWQPGVNEADPAPSPGNGAGFHAFHHPDDFFLGSRVYGEVFGAILAWGTIMVADTGFRAQYARIIGLTTAGDDMDYVAQHYEVPLFKSKKSLMRAVEEHGMALPEELRPSATDALKENPPNLNLGTPPASALAKSPRLWPEIPLPVGVALYGAGCYGLAELLARWMG